MPISTNMHFSITIAAHRLKQLRRSHLRQASQKYDAFTVPEILNLRVSSSGVRLT